MGTGYLMSTLKVRAVAVFSPKKSGTYSFEPMVYCYEAIDWTTFDYGTTIKRYDDKDWVWKRKCGGYPKPFSYFEHSFDFRCVMLLLVRGSKTV